MSGFLPFDLNFSSGTTVATADNVVIVNALSDLPAPSGGAITLENGKIYVLGSSITTADRIICGDDNVMTSNNPFTPFFTYTGTGTFFTGVDKHFLLENIAINAPTATLFNFSSPTSGGNVVGLSIVSAISCATIGTFDNLRKLNIENSGVFNADQGITILGSTNWVILTIFGVNITTSSATFIAFDFGTSIHNIIEFRSLVVTGVPGSIGISGAASSANVNANRLATVVTCDFEGGMTALSGISTDDIRWDFLENTGIQDSMSMGLLSIESNVTETVISTINTPVKMIGTWTSESTSHFTSDTNGRLTFISERDENLSIDITVTLLAASGGSDKQGTIYIAINGAIVSQTGSQGTITVSKSHALMSVWSHDFSTNDYVEVFLENNTDAINLVGQHAVIRIK